MGKNSENRRAHKQTTFIANNQGHLLEHVEQNKSKSRISKVGKIDIQRVRKEVDEAIIRNNVKIESDLEEKIRQLVAEKLGYISKKKSQKDDNTDKYNERREIAKRQRLDLEMAFGNLRALLPNIRREERASRIRVLWEASAHLDHQRNELADQKKLQIKLRKKIEKLRVKLSGLAEKEN